MRRLVDSVIFCLVAYTLLWPILRGLVHHESTAVADHPGYAVVGRCDAAPSLEVVLRGYDGDRAYPVICDADGNFRLPLASALQPGAVLEVRQLGGALLAIRTLDAEADGIIDLGLLPGRGSAPN